MSTVSRECRSRAPNPASSGVAPPAPPPRSRTRVAFATDSLQRRGARRLLAAGADPNARQTIHQLTLAMLAAMRAETTPLLEELLRAPGADINAREDTGSTALHYAVYRDNVPAVAALLARGAAQDIANQAQGTALELAAAIGAWRIACVLRAANPATWTNLPGVASLPSPSRLPGWGLVSGWAPGALRSAVPVVAAGIALAAKGLMMFHRGNRR